MKDIVNANDRFYVVMNDNSLVYLSLGDTPIETVAKDKDWKANCKLVSSGDNKYFKYMPNTKSIFTK